MGAVTKLETPVYRHVKSYGDGKFFHQSDVEKLGFTASL
jgi:hypothetical protein